MGDWKNDLPPIVKDKLARIGEATPEEKQRMKDSERLNSLLSEFYRGRLNSEGLWKRIKELRDKGKGHLLNEAQISLIDSLTLRSAAVEFQKRREGMLAIETLKEDQNTSILELELNSIEGLQKRYRDEMQQAYDNLRAQVERNPQLRMQEVKQGQTTVVMQLSVDEAVKRSSQWQDFLSRHETRYGQEFAKLIERLKMKVK